MGAIFLCFRSGGAGGYGRCGKAPQASQARPVLRTRTPLSLRDISPRSGESSHCVGRLLRGQSPREKPPLTGEVAAKQAGGAFAVRGGRPRGKRYMGGNGKVEGRACPAPTGCHKWGADERGKGGRQPSPLPWAGAAVPGSPPFPRRAKPDDACAKRGSQRFYGKAVPGLRQRRRGGNLHGPCASRRG